MDFNELVEFVYGSKDEAFENIKSMVVGTVVQNKAVRAGKKEHAARMIREALDLFVQEIGTYKETLDFAKEKEE